MAKAKRLEDIGAYAYCPTHGEEWDEKREARSVAKNTSHIQKALPIAEALKPYFGCRLHDSWVIEQRRTDGMFQLAFNNINAIDFARSLADELGVPRVEEIWRVDFRFLRPHLIKFATASRHKGLMFKPIEDLAESELISDWFFTEDNRLQWIVELWKDKGPHYLMIDCEELAVIDYCPQVFEKHFGKAGAQLYLDALNLRDEVPITFNVFDSVETCSYIRRRMVANGFTESDFVALYS